MTKSKYRGLNPDAPDRIFRARRVLIDSRTVIENGVLRVHRGTIAAVGSREDFGVDPGCPETDLGDVVLIPGLVNAHVHLDYSCCEGRLPRGRFERWIGYMSALRATLSPAEILLGIHRALVQIARSGTTTLGDIASFDLSPIGLEEAGLRYVCFYEIIHLGAPPYDAVLDHLEKRLGATNPGLRGQIGLAPHAPYTVALALMKALRERFHGPQRLQFSIHAAESKSEAACLRNATGELGRWLRKTGFYPVAPERPPVAHSVLEFVASGRKSNRVADVLVHGNYLSRAEIGFLSREDAAHLVVCPGTREYHGVKEPVFTRARRAGMTIALGTDSLASNDRLDLWAEMRRGVAQSKHWSATDAFEAATVGGARALNLEDEIGVLRAGYRADFVSIELGSAARELPAKRLIESWIARKSSPPVRGVWIDAEPILDRPLFAS